MVVVHQSHDFAAWLRTLRDDIAAARITRRLERLQLGAIGDIRSVGAGMHELRIDHGPGYRIYFVWRGNAALILLAGGTKGSQARDIRRAKSLAANLEP